MPPSPVDPAVYARAGFSTDLLTSASLPAGSESAECNGSAARHRDERCDRARPASGCGAGAPTAGPAGGPRRTRPPPAPPTRPRVQATGGRGRSHRSPAGASVLAENGRALAARLSAHRAPTLQRVLGDPKHLGRHWASVRGRTARRPRRAVVDPLTSPATGDRRRAAPRTRPAIQRQMHPASRSTHRHAQFTAARAALGELRFYRTGGMVA